MAPTLPLIQKALVFVDRAMRELNVLFVMKSVLLADMISRVVAHRLEEAGIRLRVEIANDDETAAALMLREPRPDVVFLRASGPRPAALPGAATVVLTVSDDLSLLHGPAPSDVTPLTSDALAARLIAIAVE